MNSAVVAMGVLKMLKGKGISAQMVEGGNEFNSIDLEVKGMLSTYTLRINIFNNNTISFITSNYHKVDNLVSIVGEEATATLITKVMNEVNRSIPYIRLIYINENKSPAATYEMYYPINGTPEDIYNMLVVFIKNFDTALGLFRTKYNKGFIEITEPIAKQRGLV